MNYSPKLKTAMAEIEQVIKKHDIAAIVALHTPGYGELHVAINPSYSCAFKITNGIRFRTRLEKDYDGDKTRRDKAIEDTINMFDLLASMCGPTILTSLNLLDELKKITGYNSTDTYHTPKDQTDN